MKHLLLLLVVCSVFFAFGQSALENALSKEFIDNPLKDGRWVYYPQTAKIEKIEKPQMAAILPEYAVYQVNLTNYLGYHVNQGTCIVLYDSIKDDLVFVKPIWYSDISEPLIRLFLNPSFESKEALLGLLEELHELMEMTTTGEQFVRNEITNDRITYYLLRYTQQPIADGTPVSVNEDKLYRTISVDIGLLEISSYTFINPRTGDTKTLK